MKTNSNERWSIRYARIGNQAVREAQARNRQLGITNWYSMNGLLVCDSNNGKNPEVTANTTSDRRDS